MMNLSVLISEYNLNEFTIAILIFFARILDVSIGTLRIMLVGKGKRFFSSVLGFFEVFIWLVAITQLFQNLSGIFSYIMYSAGFAAGTFIGMTIERKLALGTSIIRIIVPRNDNGLIGILAAAGYGVTHVTADGSKGPVDIIFSVVKRSRIKGFLEIIRKYKPNAFYTIEDVKTASENNLDAAGGIGRLKLLQPFYWFRKGK